MTNTNSQPDSLPVDEAGVVGGSSSDQPAAPVPLGRSIPEWRGKTPDSKVPENVRLRIFNRYGGRCYLSGRQIRIGDEWHLEHIKALADGGEHREFNLAPALVEPHKVKTKAEAKQRAKDRRIRKKNFGIYESKKPMPFGRKSNLKKTVDGRVIDRNTGEQIWPRQ